MTTTVPTSPNVWTVATDTGTALGVVMLGTTGFTAMVAGKVLGVFPTMTAAVAAITGTT